MDKVLEYLHGIENEQRKSDSLEMLSLMEKASGYQPHLAGSMVGFGSYHYKYESGREGDSMVTGFSPRKQNLAIYIMPGFSDIKSYMDRLGKFKLGKSCLYLNKLSDVDAVVLSEIIAWSVGVMKERYVCRSFPKR